MRLTPIDIQQCFFSTKFRGYDIQEVRAFLEQAADSLEAVITDKNKIQKKLNMIKQEITGYKKREDIFKRAILNSQKLLEESKRNAEKTSELIMAEAELKAEKILSHAQTRLVQLHQDIAELKRQRIQLESQIRATIETHSKLLDNCQEESKVTDEEDSKVKLFNK